MRSWVLAARGSFWFLPAVFGLVAAAVAEGLVATDHVFAGPISDIAFFSEMSADAGRSILTTIGTSMLTVAGTSFSITISVLATTSSTYGPRLVRNFMADRANQFVLAMFTSTFVYCLLVLPSVRTELAGRAAFVPTLGVHLAVLIAVVDAGVLVYFIHHIAASVQITTLQRRVQRDLIRAVDRTHPAALGSGWTRTPADAPPVTGGITGTRTGYVQQVDLDGLLEAAVRHDLLLETAVMPGDHVLEHDRLVAVLGGSEPTDAAARAVRSAFVIGVERTPEQDVRFALQQLIEVAVRGLASGSNDPYTTASALDLARAALVPLVAREAGPRGRIDDQGVLRLRFRWPSAESLVATMLDSLRQYGLGHPSVVGGTLDLVARLGAAARSAPLRAMLRRKTSELMSAYERSAPDTADLAGMRERAGAVLDGLG